VDLVAYSTLKQIQFDSWIELFIGHPVVDVMCIS